MTIELVPLCSVRGELSALALPDTPVGTRVIFEVTDGALEGERLRGKAVSAGADWMVLTPDGTGMVDVRFTLETDDGALVYIQYDGRFDVTGGPGSAPLYVAPRFETGDARYAWLNKVQAVGKGTFDPETNVVLYEWYEVR